MAAADIGVIGLAVMGQNLVLNMSDHGYSVAVYNRSRDKTDRFLADLAPDRPIVGTHAIEELVGSLKSPRIVMLMVKAGSVVDDYVHQLLPHLHAGDIVVDGGNSDFKDTNRRVREAASKGILYLGVGVSGGEEGARHGPSIMPGGNEKAWPAVKDLFLAIAAKVDGVPCCDWIGPDGAGHYVKMVHNGIEYGDMQLICEAYHLMSAGLDLDTDRIGRIFAEWNRGVLDSYLVEITGQILQVRDADGEPLVNKVLDSAGQKGTGKWTGINALELGVPLTLIGEAVFARFVSALKDQRVRASHILPQHAGRFDGDREAYVGFIHDALYASKIVSYTQGFHLLREASRVYGWALELGNIALLWRGGCIIRSRFLNDIKRAFDSTPSLESLLVDDFFRDALANAQAGWRKAVVMGIELGIPTPAFNAALSYYDGYRSARLPANLLQAQRDYFGAHTYERVDRPRGQSFHTDWKREFDAQAD